MREFKPGERAARSQAAERELNRELAKRMVLRESSAPSVNTARGIPAVKATQIRVSAPWTPSRKLRTPSYFKRTAEYRRLTGTLTAAAQIKLERQQDKLRLLTSAGIIGNNEG